MRIQMEKWKIEKEVFERCSEELSPWWWKSGNVIYLKLTSEDLTKSLRVAWGLKSYSGSWFDLLSTAILSDKEFFFFLHKSKLYIHIFIWDHFDLCSTLQTHSYRRIQVNINQQLLQKWTIMSWYYVRITVRVSSNWI